LGLGFGFGLGLGLLGLGFEACGLDFGFIPLTVGLLLGLRRFSYEGKPGIATNVMT